MDDGGARHLRGHALPPVALPSTDGEPVRLDALEGRTVLFAYPRTGTPGEAPPGGEERWDAIPGARGCTPQVCAIRDDMPAFAARGVRVLGVSTQTPAEQREAAERLGLPYALLSDADGELERALDLPAFEVDGLRMLRRLTLLLRDGVIEDAIYPVFPPGDAARAALERLRAT